MSSPIQLIVGLGNPGADYAATRHNVGAWFVHQLADGAHIPLKLSMKFHAFVGQGEIGKTTCRLLIPNVYMNESGRSVAAFSQYYHIPSTALLVAHDELDFPAGDIRLKQGGGHGGHNGLRSLIQSLGNAPDFSRVRIGIGHPGNKHQVSNYVLSRPTQEEKNAIDHAIHTAISHIPEIVQGQFQAVMTALHTKNGSVKDGI